MIDTVSGHKLVVAKEGSLVRVGALACIVLLFIETPVSISWPGRILLWVLVLVWLVNGWRWKFNDAVAFNSIRPLRHLMKEFLDAEKSSDHRRELVEYPAPRLKAEGILIPRIADEDRWE